MKKNITLSLLLLIFCTASSLMASDTNQATPLKKLGMQLQRPWNNDPRTVALFSLGIASSTLGGYILYKVCTDDSKKDNAILASIKGIGKSLVGFVLILGGVMSTLCSKTAIDLLDNSVAEYAHCLEQASANNID